MGRDRDAIASTVALQALMCRADLVVGHGGYNTVHEVLRSGVRAVLVPFDRRTEDQRRRLRRLADTGRITMASADTTAVDLRRLFARALETDRPKPLAFDGAERAASAILDTIGRPARVVVIERTDGSVDNESVESIRSAVASRSAPAVLISVSWMQAAHLQRILTSTVVTRSHAGWMSLLVAMSRRF